MVLRARVSVSSARPRGRASERVGSQRRVPQPPGWSAGPRCKFRGTPALCQPMPGDVAGPERPGSSCQPAARSALHPGH
eukprot:11172469-Lingulodinium_polyedra.AAC.1